MIDLQISDSTGNQLMLTTNIDWRSFDAVTCSPHADGFTVLNGLLGGAVPKAQLEAACNETVTRNEVCVLPNDVSSKWRVLLTPTLRSLDQDSRLNASRLMKDLFCASQAQQVKASRLLITHFACVRKYPEPHVQGIFDAIKDLTNSSFLGLRVLGFEIAAQHLAQFERHLSNTFAAQPGAPRDAPQAARPDLYVRAHEMSLASEQFENAIVRLTEPLNGQYPRPWMTELADPLSATVFIVGKNQAKGYDADRISHERHLDALFNRSGESCRGLYNEMTGNSPSPTRRNTDRFHSILASHGIARVLETNVVCYSTPMSSALRLAEHRGCSVRGTEIFQTLLHFVRPRVLVAHGAGTRETLSVLLGEALPPVPKEHDEPEPVIVNSLKIFVIPSLAPPQWNQWQGWASPYLDKVARAAASAL